MSASDEVPALGSRRVWRFTVQLLKREIYCHHVMYWSRDKCRPAGSVWLFCSFSEAEANVSCQASWHHYVPVIAADLSLVGYMCTTAKTTAWIHEMLHLLHSMQMKLWLAAVQPLAALRARANQACTPAVYFGTGLKISDNLVSLTPWQFQLSRTGAGASQRVSAAEGFSWCSSDREQCVDKEDSREHLLQSGTGTGGQRDTSPTLRRQLKLTALQQPHTWLIIRKISLI